MTNRCLFWFAFHCCVKHHGQKKSTGRGKGIFHSPLGRSRGGNSGRQELEQSRWMNASSLVLWVSQSVRIAYLAVALGTVGWALLHLSCPSDFSAGQSDEGIFSGNSGLLQVDKNINQHSDQGAGLETVAGYANYCCGTEEKESVDE